VAGTSNTILGMRMGPLNTSETVLSCDSNGVVSKWVHQSQKAMGLAQFHSNHEFTTYNWVDQPGMVVEINTINDELIMKTAFFRALLTMIASLLF
jgi:hypothetical protein